MNAKDIVAKFKTHQLQYGLNGDSTQQELYKWKLVTKQIGHPDTDADDFEKEIRSLTFKNLCFSTQTTAIRHFAEYEPEEYRDTFRGLFDENVDLQQRIDTFISTCKTLWDGKIKKNFSGNTSAMCDERLISCFLTLHNPQKYTFYKSDVYGNLCSLLGVESKKAGQKLVHFYELLKDHIVPLVENDMELMSSINEELQKEGLIQSTMLSAQTALWYYASKLRKNSQKQIWLFLGGKDAKDYHFEEMYNDGVMALCGWDLTGDLSDCKDEDSIEARRQTVLEYKYNTGNLKGMLNAIANEIKEGDIILAKYSKSDIVGMGTVTSDYHYEDASTYGKHIRDITWTHKGTWHCQKILKEFGQEEFPAKALTNISKAKYTSKLLELIEGESNETRTNDKNLSPMKEVDILKQKKQIVLQGAPGTGKTYKTAAIAVAMCDGESSVPADRNALMVRYKQLVVEKRIAFTTFHQSMDYEEFVEGIKPETEDGTISYVVRDGIFREICKAALNAQRVESNDNFEEVWNKLITYLDENDFIDVMLLNGSKTFRVELNELGTGLTNRTYPNDTFSKGNWIDGKSKFFSKDQLYNIYRGLPGTPAGGHDNYRRAIINHLKKEFGLVEYKQGEKSNANVKNYVLIIDEINRANISKVLGELITLLETDKRLGELNEVKVRLPYSKDEFGVPSNLYVIGTMNTADRSVGYIDYAIRRRFAFVTIKSDRNVVEEYNPSIATLALEYFDKVKEWMTEENVTGDIDAEDLMVGHSYFLADNEAKLKAKMVYEVIPLLREYINDGILTSDIKKELTDWETELG